MVTTLEREKERKKIIQNTEKHQFRKRGRKAMRMSGKKRKVKYLVWGTATKM